MYQTSIAWMPKPIGDSMSKENYRPSGKQNPVVYIYVWKGCVCVCVSKPNSGISEIQEWFNTRKSVNIMHHVNRLNEEIYMIIFINIIKAFDKTDHSFFFVFFNLGASYLRYLHFNETGLNYIFFLSPYVVLIQMLW